MTKNALPKARELTGHRVNTFNEHFRVFVLDAPDDKGSCHEYAILMPMDAHDDVCEQHGPTPLENFLRYNLSMKPSGLGEVTGTDLYIGTYKNPGLAKVVTYDTSDPDPGSDANVDNYNVIRISFQNGAIKDHGVNGIGHEVLFAILIDRVEGFQSGSQKSQDNQVILEHLQGARLWSHKRTLDRTSRNQD